MTDAQTTLRVAAAQIAIDERIEGNVSKILETMRWCATQGVALVVFPEAAVSGYSPMIGHQRDVREWPAIQEALNAIATLAGQLGLWTVIGTEALEDGTWFNRAYAYSDQGEQVAAYDKVHLTNADTAYYRPGASYPVFQIRGIRVGLQICYDARFPEGYRALLAQGVEVIAQGFYGAGSHTWKVPVLAAHLRSRAAENGCFVVAANMAGPLQIVVSQVIDPLGLMLAEANQDCEQVIVADLDLRRVLDSEIRRDYLTRFDGRAWHT